MVSVHGGEPGVAGRVRSNSSMHAVRADQATPTSAARWAIDPPSLRPPSTPWTRSLLARVCGENPVGHGAVPSSRILASGITHRAGQGPRYIFPIPRLPRLDPQQLGSNFPQLAWPSATKVKSKEADARIRDLPPTLHRKQYGGQLHRHA